MLVDNMKSFFLIIVIILFVLISCVRKQNDLNPSEEILAYTEEYVSDCFESEFYKYVRSYIKKTKGFFCNDTVYYSVYFFTKDSTDYFVIWTNYSSPKGMIEYNNPSSNFRYSTLKVNEDDIIIITKNEYNNQQLYQHCVFLVQKDSIPYHKNAYTVDYDGRLYIETYKYDLQDGKYVLNKLENPIVDIFGNLPKRFW